MPYMPFHEKHAAGPLIDASLILIPHPCCDWSTVPFHPYDIFGTEQHDVGHKCPPHFMRRSNHRSVWNGRFYLTFSRSAFQSPFHRDGRAFLWSFHRRAFQRFLPVLTPCQ